jgi:transcriptional regulator with XRE-family HTH domain
MNDFRSSKIKIEKENLGEQLKKARVDKEIKIIDAAQQLGISQVYLEAIEKGNFQELPKGIYGKNFVKEYSEFLGLDSNELIKRYIKETDGKSRQNKNDPFSKKVLGAQYFLTIPKAIKNIFIVLILVVCLVYLGYYLNNIISPPILIIESPNDDYITKERHVIVRGQTEVETEIIINDDKVLIDNEGRFFKDLNLKNGLNTIVIEAKKKYSRTNTVIRKVLVENGEK